MSWLGAAARRPETPFAAAVAVAATSQTLSRHTGHAQRWFLVGTAALAVVGVLHVLVVRHRAALPGWAAAVAPLGFFVVVAAWREAGGGAASGFGEIGILPVVWLALYGTRRALWASIGALGALVVLPLALIGPPAYPMDSWRSGTLLVTVALIVGLTVERLVRSVRRELAERSAVETALAANEERLRLIIDGTVDHAIIMVSPAGRVATWNAGARRLTGYEAGEVIGRHVSVFREPAAVASGEVDHDLVVAAETGQYADVQRRVRRDGTGYWASVTIAPLRDGQGRLLGFSEIARDLSDAKAAEDELRAAEERFRRTFDDAPVGMFLADLDGRLTRVNGEMCRIVGQPLEVVRTRRVTELVEPDEAPRTAETVTAIAEGRQPSYSGEVPFRNGFGAPRWASVHLAPITGGDGRPAALLGHVQDVTESRLLREERVQLLDEMRLLLDGSGEGIFGLDADRRITFVNRQAGILLGRPNHELLGQPVAQIHRHADAETSCPIEASICEGKEYREADEAFHRGDGTVFPVEYVIGPLIRQGDVNGAVVVFSDISERKATEDALHESLMAKQETVERLQDLETTRSNFVATVSHELRTPLTSITGYLEMLLDGDGGELRPEAERMLQVMQRNSERLLVQVEDLLTAAKIEQGAMRIDRRPVDVGRLVTGVIDAVEPLAAERSQRLESETRPSVATATVSGDARELERMLLNLVGNAIKFTPDGGTVRVVSSVAGDHVRIDVTDTGIGISGPEQARLFERFYRARAADQQSIQGSGLGLSIVRSIVEGHGGTVGVVSAPGQGSTFTVLLPSDRVGV